jgi:hypothetical protein
VRPGSSRGSSDRAGRALGRAAAARCSATSTTCALVSASSSRDRERSALDDDDQRRPASLVEQPLRRLGVARVGGDRPQHRQPAPAQRSRDGVGNSA